ncbi:MAG: CsgG/HfaB family protein [Proteobacteria bacterium]|nr:CsgG/HfaB family protein [Pseudomonadota bacterium]
MQSRKQTFRSLFVLTAFSAVVLAAGWAPAAVLKAVVFPFAVHSQDNMGFLERGVVDMLASRLAVDGRISVVEKSRVLAILEKDSGPMTPERADALAGQLGADYAVWGSLTVLGQAVSLDAWVKEAGAPGAPNPVYSQVQGMGQVIAGVDVLAAGVRDRILGITAAAPAAPAPVPTAAPVPLYAHPDRLLDRGTLDAPSLPAPGAVETSRSGAGFWKSPAIRAEVSGLACADADGDGANEVLVMDRRNVWVKRLEQGRLVTLAQFEGPAHRKNLWLDAGDVNGNGRAEIFVTSLGANGRLESFVLEASGALAPGLSPGGAGLVVLAQNQNWAFRTIAAKGGVELYGQNGGASEAFLPGIYRLNPVEAKNGYEKQGSLPLPGGTLVFGLARGSFGETAPMIVAVDNRDRLRAWDESGEFLWKNGQDFGGTEKQMDRNPDEKDSSIQFLPGRVMAMPAGAGMELVTVDNQGSAGKLLARFRLYTSATVRGLYWDGLGFVEAWTTREISGYVPDFTVGDVDNDGMTELACAVVQERDSLGKSGKSVVIIYEINQLGE